MNFFKNYINYLKDNPNHYWFKKRKYGWGWTPATWEGWLSIAVFVALLVLVSILTDAKTDPSAADFTLLFVEEFLMVALFLYVCYKKGEKLNWPRGNKK